MGETQINKPKRDVFMTKIILAFLVFLIVSWVNAKRKHSWLTPSSFLISLYTFSLLMAIVDIPLNDDTLILQNKYWGASAFMTIMLLVFLYPILRFDESKINRLKLPSRRVLNCFSSIIIILSFIAILYYIPTVINLLRGDLGALRNALYAGEEYVEAGLMNTIASVSSSLYVFALLMFYIYLIVGGGKWRIVLLFISSFSNIFHVLTFVGRDGVVFWIFAFLYLYLLFSPFLSIKHKSKLKKISIIVISVMLIPFILISIGRFQESTGTLNSIVNYFGQPFVYGSLYFGIDNPPLDPGNTFPLFYEFTGIAMPKGTGRWEMGGTVSWVFGTFLKSLYSSLGGLPGLLLFCFFSGTFFIIVFGKKKSIFSFSKMFIYILYFEVYAQGVFYFRQYTRGGNLFILICLILSLVFSFMPQIVKKPIYVNRVC